MEIPSAATGDARSLEVDGATASDRGAQMVEDLLQLGIAISSEGELSPVLERIVTQARRFTGAEAATLFLREGTHGGVIPFHPRLEDVARAFAAYAAIAVRSARLEELSFKDPLTDGYNRRYLMLRLYEEVSRAARYQQPLSLILLDLDGFKAINDRWGHGAGDDVLKQVVQLLASQSRRDSVVARYGGDEFIALLPSTTKAAAVVYAERMRAIIERYPFQHGPLTASFGVAGYPDDPGNVVDLIKRADHALYEAKRQGRNLVGGL